MRCVRPTSTRPPSAVSCPAPAPTVSPAPRADAALKSVKLDDELRGAFIVAADTVVAVGRRILPKANLVDEAAQCLRLLSGRNHRVYTAICLSHAEGGVSPAPDRNPRSLSSASRKMTSRPISGSGDSRGKAGGYAVQGIAGSFVVKMVGSYTNIVGLPLYESISLLGGEGFPEVASAGLMQAATGKATPDGAARKPCPICGKPSVGKPIPSVRNTAVDVDLNRWLSGSYAIPVRADEDDDNE